MRIRWRMRGHAIVRIRDFARVYHVCFEHVHRKKSHASQIKNSLDSSHSL